MTSKRFVFFVVGILIAASARAEMLSLPIVKNDGEVSFYRMMKVHRDPGQARLVEERLARSEPVRGLPSSYTIPDSALPPIRDQGERGTCAYFATLGLVETYYMAKSPSYGNINLSVECLTDVRNWMFDQKTYTGDDKPGERPDPNGDDPWSVGLTITHNGVPLSAKYGSAECRYADTSDRDLSLDDYLATFSGSSGSFPFAKGIGFDYNTAPTIDSIRALIAGNIPVEVGVLVYDEDFNDPVWRYNVFDDNEQTLAGGHAIQLTGYATLSDGHTMFLFKNSWGKFWGMRGWGQIREDRIIHGWKYEKDLEFTLSMHD